MTKQVEDALERLESAIGRLEQSGGVVPGGGDAGEGNAGESNTKELAEVKAMIGEAMSLLSCGDAPPEEQS